MSWTTRCSNFRKIYSEYLVKSFRNNISRKQKLLKVMKNSSKNHNKITNSAVKVMINLIMHGGNKMSYTLKLKPLGLFKYVRPLFPPCIKRLNRKNNQNEKKE